MWPRVVVLPLVLISPFVERPSIYILVIHQVTGVKSIPDVRHPFSITQPFVTSAS